jgi:hypothetical protein
MKMDPIEEALRIKMVRNGFTRRTKDLYTQEIAPSALAWTGFGRGFDKETGTLWINATVGLLNVEVETLVAAAQGEPFDGYSPPTSAQQIGLLMPEPDYRRWDFNNHVESQIDEISNVIDRWGLPFSRSIVPLPRLLDALLNPRIGISFMKRPRVAALYLLLGDRKAAEKYVASNLSGGVGNLTGAEFLKRLLTLANQRAPQPPDPD